MIIGVDIGGTKTLISVFAENGKLLKEVRFKTNEDYDTFLKDLSLRAQNLETKKAKSACIAVPGLLNRRTGVVESLGNLPWRDVPIRGHLSIALGINNIQIENDSKLAGLAEARIISDKFKRVFYLTISTGIGGALIVNGKLAKNMQDSEIGKAPLEFNGKIQPWEEFASGRAFYKLYKQKAIDVKDDKTWKEFSRNICAGLGVVCATFQPEAIVFGGGLGQRLNRYKPYLEQYLQEHLHTNIRQPRALVSSHFRGQSVIYGCYEFAKDNLA